VFHHAFAGVSKRAFCALFAAKRLIRTVNFKTINFNGSRAPQFTPVDRLWFLLGMISAQTRSAFVARENRFTLFRIML
jgi:hypothetical protein